MSYGESLVVVCLACCGEASLGVPDLPHPWSCDLHMCSADSCLRETRLAESSGAALSSHHTSSGGHTLHTHSRGPDHLAATGNDRHIGLLLCVHLPLLPQVSGRGWWVWPGLYCHAGLTCIPSSPCSTHVQRQAWQYCIMSPTS